MIIENVKEEIIKIINSLFQDCDISTILSGDEEYIEVNFGTKSNVLLEIGELVEIIKKFVASRVIEKIKEENGFNSVPFETFIEKFAGLFSAAQLKSLVKNVAFMTSKELLGICEMIKIKYEDEKIKDEKGKKKYEECIKSIISTIVERGGGDKKFWREMLEKVEGYDISDVNEMVEKKIEESMEF